MCFNEQFIKSNLNARSRPESVEDIPYRCTLGEMAGKHGNQMCPAVKAFTSFVCRPLFYHFFEN